MSAKRLMYYENELNSIKKNYEEYLANPNLSKIEDVVKKCNIFEDYNVKYLEEIQKQKDEALFQKILEKYQDSISSEIMQKKFSFSKLNGKDNIKAIINRLIIIGQKVYHRKFESLQEEIATFVEELEKVYFSRFKINFQLLPSDNLELYLNTINRIFCGKILAKLIAFEEHKNFEQKDIDYIKEKEKELQIKEKPKVKKEMEKETKKIEKPASKDEIMLKAFKIMKNQKFIRYFEYLGYFLEKVNNNYSKRFDNIQFEKEEDLKLIRMFILFLSNYDFRDLDQYFIDVWNESFNNDEITDEYIKNKLQSLNIENEKKEKISRFVFENDTIKVTIMNNQLIIPNIKIYSFKALFNYLEELNISSDINDFNLMHFVKIQHFNDFLKEKIINQKWKQFYYDIFNSKVIKNLLELLFTYNFKDCEFKQIIDSIEFFNFDCEEAGETTDIGIFISGIMDLKINNQIKNSWKIKYYIKIFMAILHEILDHKLIHIQNHLINKNNLSSVIKGEKSDEFALVKLFGDKFKVLKMGQICFIFDKKNYENENLNDFIEKFKQSGKIIDPKVPEIIEDIIGDEVQKIIFISIDSYKSKPNDFVVCLHEEEPKICYSAFLNDTL